jgi:hypothetical protein
MADSQQDILSKIVAAYAPYDKMPAFQEGFAAYQAGVYLNPYENERSLDG